MMTPIISALLVGLAPGGATTASAPQIELWTDRDFGTVYHRGERVRVYFRSSDDAYVTVFRVDTDGRVRVLFPRDPWEDNFARGGRAYEVRQPDERYAFFIDEYPGEGYVFAIGTLDPFDYHAIVQGDHWDYRAMASGGRFTGDPYVAVQDLVDLVVPANYDAYSYDVATYYVEQYYEYPRFLCYDCHSYVAYPYWDPYHYSCVRFRIVIYDDPYYYPTRAYAGTRVVYRRVARIEPRYVFKDRGATDTYVVRVRQRPAEPASRRGEERGATGRDVGGVGAVPAPGGRAPAGRVPDAVGTPGAEPVRRPDQVGQPVPRRRELVIPNRRPGGEQPTIEPRRVPDRVEAPPATDRPRTPSGFIAPAGDPRTPTQLVPRTLPPREEERPRLERREPPPRNEPLRPTIDARPPAAQPSQPVRKPEAAPPQKKPDVAPARRKPGN